MIDQELQELAHQGPDRSLERLEADIWATLAERERALRRSRGLLVLQAAVLLFALAGSTLAGRELARRQSSDALAVLRPHLLLEDAILAADERP